MRGSKIQKVDRVAATGLACELRQLDRETTIAPITMPAPEYSPEACFAAAVYRAPKPPEAALTRFFTLECGQPGPHQSPFLCEWTQDDTHHVRSAIASAEMDTFFRCVCDMVNMARA